MIRLLTIALLVACLISTRGPVAPPPPTTTRPPPIAPLHLVAELEERPRTTHMDQQSMIWDPPSYDLVLRVVPGSR